MLPGHDALLTVEDPYDEYVQREAADWENEAPAERFWHLVFGPDRASMSRAVALRKEHNAGYVYVTDDQLTPDDLGHTCDTMPADNYWRAELLAVFGEDLAPPGDVTPPS